VIVVVISQQDTPPLNLLPHTRKHHTASTVWVMPALFIPLKVTAKGTLFSLANTWSLVVVLSNPSKYILSSFTVIMLSIGVASCGGGGGGGSGDGESAAGSGDSKNDAGTTDEAQAFNAFGFARSDSDILAVAPGRDGQQPDFVIVRSSDDPEDYELLLRDNEGKTVTATVGADDRVASLRYSFPAEGEGADGDANEDHRFEFSNYNDELGEVVVTYTNPDGTAVTDIVTAADSADGLDREPPEGDLTGTWSSVETVTADSCGDLVGEQFTESFGIEQSGSDLTVAFAGSTFSGSVSGSQINWTGSFAEEEGETRMTLAASANEQFSQIDGTTDWTWTDAASGISCTGSSEFTASQIGGLSMMSSGLAVTASEDGEPRSLNDRIDEALETLSDPFETYLPLNLYKQAGEAVEDIANAARERFEQVRQSVQEGSDGLKELATGLKCQVSQSSCAEVAARDADALVDDLERLDADQSVDAGFEVSSTGIAPDRAEWDAGIADGVINTDFELIDTPCEESVFATMNPDCPQYEPPETDSGDGTGGDTGSDSGGDSGSDTGGDTGGDTGSDSGGDAGSDADPNDPPTATSNHVWVDPWGTGEDLTLPPAMGGGWMLQVMDECASGSKFVDCTYAPNEYGIADISVRFSDFTDDVSQGGVPREAAFYRRCNLLKESGCHLPDLQYMTVEWSNDGDMVRVRNTRGETIFINDLRNWDVDGRPTSVTEFPEPFDSRERDQLSQTYTGCRYWDDHTENVTVIESVVENGEELSRTEDVREACPLPDGFQGYQDERPVLPLGT
jgi:hypothetical protein